MRTTALALLFFALALGIPTSLAKEPAPAIPNTAAGLPAQAGGTLMGTVEPAALAQQTRSAADMEPVRVRIPAIGLDAPVQTVGILTNGELGVPSGSTNNVGWWAGGTLPGQVGSAVLDAHVFAAFKELRYAKVGDDIYVTGADGAVLHFVVQTTETFKLGNLSPAYLFDRADARRLTLITCAGQLTPDRSTYTERLMVSAVLAQ